MGGKRARGECEIYDANALRSSARARRPLQQRRPAGAAHEGATIEAKTEGVPTGGRSSWIFILRQKMKRHFGCSGEPLPRQTV